MNAMQKPATLAAILILASLTAHADAIYYCNKNGKKIVTDRPCEEFGAQEKRRINPQDLPPLSTSQGLRPDQIEQARQIDQRNQQQAQIDEQQRQAMQRQAQAQQGQKSQICASLESHKQSLIAAQRMPNSMQTLNYYREELRKVNDELYARRCETL